MKKTFVIWAILAALGLAGGWFGQPYLSQKSGNDAKATSEEIREELSTDAFSLRLFQHTLTEKPAGNILVMPHVISDALLVLQELSAGKTHEEIQGLQLKACSTLRATEPAGMVLPAMDFNLPRGEKSDLVMPLPFSEDVPKALSLFNGMLAGAMEKSEAQLADSKMISSRTKLLVGCVSIMNRPWEIPFNSANTRTADFDNASGGMPHFRQLRSRGLFRTATAEDGSWRALAIPFKKDDETGATLYYIGILPAGSARDFATKLSTGQLTGIRKALAEATPEDTLVEIPRLELQILPFDMRDSLRRLGLKALFDSETADFAPLTPEKIHLGAFLHAASVSLIESPDSSKADESLDYAKNIISFTRPYIWLIADLETPTPIDFMGLVEEM